MRHSFFSFLFLLLLVVPVYETCKADEMSIKAGKIFDLCYQFKFISADSLMNSYFITMKNGEELELNLLQANVLWWKIISGLNDKITIQNYYKTLDKAEFYFQKEKETSNAYLYKATTLYGYLARMDGMNKNYLKALFRLNSCIKYLEKSFGSETKYPFFYLTSGLYNYHIVAAQKQYPIITPYLWLYPKGNKAKGIEQLKMAASNQNKYLSTEAQYFLMKLYLEEKNYNEAMNYANILHQKFPNNAIFMYYHFLLSLKLKMNNEARIEAEKLLENLKNNKEINSIQIKHFEQLLDHDLKAFHQKKYKHEI